MKLNVGPTKAIFIIIIKKFPDYIDGFECHWSDCGIMKLDHHESNQLHHPNTIMEDHPARGHSQAT